jgi:hypothetical protein
MLENPLYLHGTLWYQSKFVKSKGVLLCLRRMADSCAMVPSPEPGPGIKVDDARSDRPKICLTLMRLVHHVRPQIAVNLASLGLGRDLLSQMTTSGLDRRWVSPMGYSMTAAPKMAKLPISHSVTA